MTRDLKQIAAQLRRLPESLDFESRLNVDAVAGDLVLEAIKLGAFSGPEYVELQNLIRRQQLTLPRIIGGQGTGRRGGFTFRAVRHGPTRPEK